jgi:hypothetical protein
MGATDSRDRGNGLLSGADMETLKKIGRLIDDISLGLCFALAAYYWKKDESSDSRGQTLPPHAGERGGDIHPHGPEDH